MTYDDAIHILALNAKGKYRGERSRLLRAIEIVADGAEPGEEECETWWGPVELGIDIGGES